MRHDGNMSVLEPLPAEETDDIVLARRLEKPRRCRVLVVDDDDLVRRRLCSLLRASKFDVIEATCGEDALRILTEVHCDLMLTDWMMPDMDGLSLCRRVRGAPMDHYVYVLMLSVRDSDRDVLDGLAAGADDYVIKGASVEEILARLEVGRRITHVDRSVRDANEHHRRLSFVDPLTQAGNFRYFSTYLPREISRAQRYGHPLSILSCDIDGLKSINDRHGHPVGDRILAAFVERCGNSIRQNCDWIARVGGDEFIIVLPETNLHGALKVKHKLRRMFKAEPVATTAGPLQLSVSIGATEVEANLVRNAALSLTDIVHKADQRMYANKRRAQVRPAPARERSGHAIN